MRVFENGIARVCVRRVWISGATIEQRLALTFIMLPHGNSHTLTATGTETSGIQNRLGVLFFMLLYLSLMSLSSLPIWRDEKLLFMRERASGVYGTRGCGAGGGGGGEMGGRQPHATHLQPHTSVSVSNSGVWTGLFSI